jgi:hypothetical protein
MGAPALRRAELGRWKRAARRRFAQRPPDPLLVNAQEHSLDTAAPSSIQREADRRLRGNVDEVSKVYQRGGLDQRIPGGPARTSPASTLEGVGVPGRVSSGRHPHPAGADFCSGCTEDAPYGTFLWLEATVAVTALFAALVLSIGTSRWASVGRVLTGSLAASVLAFLPATLRQTGGLNYTSVPWGYQIALIASLVATVIAAFVTFRRPTEASER